SNVLRRSSRTIARCPLNEKADIEALFEGQRLSGFKNEFRIHTGDFSILDFGCTVGRQVTITVCDWHLFFLFSTKK
ncbi:MAG: hypothetical protein AAEI08_02880, partial [Gammaproteobacteria bacterium]